jgi:hypothetical protein
MYWLETGHICACNLVSPASSDHERRRPVWRFSKEKLFSDDPTGTHVGATLVYTGHGSTFCLLECVIIYYKYHARPYNFKEKDVHPHAFRYLYRVTTFSLTYDGTGDLTTGESQRVRYYEAPKDSFVCSVLGSIQGDFRGPFPIQMERKSGVRFGPAWEKNHSGFIPWLSPHGEIQSPCPPLRIEPYQPAAATRGRQHKT